MTAGDDDLQTLLTTTAEQAGGLRMTRADIERAARRRRRAGRAAGGALVVAAVTVVAIGVAVPLSRTGGGPGGGSGAGGGSIEPAVVNGHALPRGAPLAPPVARTGDHGMRLAVTNVARDAAGGPAVTVTLTATAEVRVALPGRTPLHVWLLIDGAVVDRLATYGMTADDPATDWIGGGPRHWWPGRDRPLPAPSRPAARGSCGSAAQGTPTPRQPTAGATRSSRQCPRRARSTGPARPGRPAGSTAGVGPGAVVRPVTVTGRSSDTIDDLRRPLVPAPSWRKSAQRGRLAQQH